MSIKMKGRGSIRTRRNLAEFDASDPYQPQLDPGEVAACTGCQAVYQRRHWFFDHDTYVRETMQPTTRLVLCPACQKIRDSYAEGQVTLQPSAFLSAHKDEIVRLIHNEEDRAKGMNPLERIVALKESEDSVVITTTNEKLAQRIGRALKNAFQGKTTYRWSEPKFLSVEWERSE